MTKQCLPWPNTVMATPILKINMHEPAQWPRLCPRRPAPHFFDSCFPQMSTASFQETFWCIDYKWMTTVWLSYIYMKTQYQTATVLLNLHCENNENKFPCIKQLGTRDVCVCSVPWEREESGQGWEGGLRLCTESSSTVQDIVLENHSMPSRVWPAHLWAECWETASLYPPLQMLPVSTWFSSTVIFIKH